MQTVDTVIAARWLIPVEPEDAVWERHALAIDRGRIVALQPAAQLAERYRGREHVALDDHVVMPGLINAHTHAAMTLMRGLADDLPLMPWLQQHIWPAEARVVSPDYVRAGTRLALLEQLYGGVTCINDMYFFPDAVVDAAVEAGLRAAVGLIVIEFPSAYASDADDYLSKAEALIERRGGEPGVSFALAPHAPYTVSDASLQRAAALAERYALPLHIHVHETAAEVERAVAEHGSRPLARLHRLGLLGPRLAAVHMTQLLDDEIALCADSGLSVLHCPESNLKLASGFCPVARLDAAGVNVAIGTDGAASNNDLDMFGEMRSAALLAKAVAGDASALPAARALRMATLHGARALGLAGQIGSLEVGKRADLIAVDLNRPATAPVHRALSQIVYAAGRDQVSDVWVDGERLLAERRPTRVDAARIVAEAGRWRERVRGGKG